MRKTTKKNPSLLNYEGNEPYIYFASAEADKKKAEKIRHILLCRGVRVWTCCGPAGSAQELLRRQERSAGAALTVLYLTDAACADKDTKSFVLVNQKTGRPILCLDPDETDRRLKFGLRETVPHVPLYLLKRDEEIESAILHADGFSQEMLGEAVIVRESGSLLKTLSIVFCVLAVLLAGLAFSGRQWLGWFRPPDEVEFTDPAISSAVREAAGRGAITKELADTLTVLRLKELPSSWDDLAKLPSLERLEIPQQAVAEGGTLPDDGLTLVLTGGGGK